MQKHSHHLVSANCVLGALYLTDISYNTARRALSFCIKKTEAQRGHIN